MNPAICDADANSTSPPSGAQADRPGRLGDELMPTSITTAPGLITAVKASSRLAHRDNENVRLRRVGLQIASRVAAVTVAICVVRLHPIGRPAMRLWPTTTASAPRIGAAA